MLEEKTDGAGGRASSAPAKVGAGELLQLLVEQERQDYVDKSVTAAVSTKAARRAAEQEAQRKPGKSGRVKLIICAWHHPETTQKYVVLPRGPTLSSLFSAAREILFIKKPKVRPTVDSTGVQATQRALVGGVLTRGVDARVDVPSALPRLRTSWAAACTSRTP